MVKNKRSGAEILEIATFRLQSTREKTTSSSKGINVWKHCKSAPYTLPVCKPCQQLQDTGAMCTS